MVDLMQQARELLAAEWRKLNANAPADELVAGCNLPPLIAASVEAIAAALRAAPEGYVLVPVQTLESIRDSSTDPNARGFAAGAMLAARPQGARHD